jgi:nitrite reductase/ring-hydroxylating ferredoxin subunit
MTQRHVVCAVEDLPPGTSTIVPVGKFGVGVYNIAGRLHAIANYCAHEGAPLCAGLVVGTNEYAPEAPGQLRRVKVGEIVRCPWHHWEFDIATGVALAHPRKRVPTYVVEIVDGKVYVTA